MSLARAFVIAVFMVSVPFLAVVGNVTLGAATSAMGDSREAVDLDALTSKLADTKALGLFTKLSLKREVDAFEKDVQTYHQHKGDSTLDQLEERYELMVDKLLVLIQDKDQALAQDIQQARAQVWAKLADPDEFAKL